MADVAELAGLGAQIVEIGTELQQLRVQRTRLDEEIASLETTLRPLVVRHSQIVAEFAGVPAPAPPPNVQHPTPGSPTTASPALVAAVLRFIENAEEGVTPLAVADALKLDSFLVREIMRSHLGFSG